jgi:phosphotriesterase-related protein
MIAEAKYADVCSDNLRLDSVEDACNELLYFRRARGKSLVEVTPAGEGKNVKGLKQISMATGLNIICATGWFTEPAQPPMVKTATVAELANVMIRELTEGFEGLDIKAGVIGEIGCSEPLGENEKKVLAAAGQAQSKTGAPLTIHTALFDYVKRKPPHSAPDELDILRRNDADLEKVYVSHMDWTCDDLDYHGNLVDTYGVVVEYDTFGQDGVYENNVYFGAGGVTDKERVNALVELLNRGYAKHLMISHDVWEKMYLRKWGGYGYAHIAERIVPLLKHRGISDNQISTLTIENPKRIFSW